MGAHLTDAATGNGGIWVRIVSLCLITSLCVCQHPSPLLRSYLSITAPSTFLLTTHTCMHAHTHTCMLNAKHQKIWSAAQPAGSHNCSYITLSHDLMGHIFLTETQIRFRSWVKSQALNTSQPERLCQIMRNYRYRFPYFIHFSFKSFKSLRHTHVTFSHSRFSHSHKILRSHSLSSP